MPRITTRSLSFSGPGVVHVVSLTVRVCLRCREIGEKEGAQAQNAENGNCCQFMQHTHTVASPAPPLSRRFRRLHPKRALSQVQGLNERVVPVGVFTVNAARLGVCAAGRSADAIEQVSHLSVTVEERLGTFTRGHRNCVSGHQIDLGSIRRRLRDGPGVSISAE